MGAFRENQNLFFLGKKSDFVGGAIYVFLNFDTLPRIIIHQTNEFFLFNDPY